MLESRSRTRSRKATVPAVIEPEQLDLFQLAARIKEEHEAAVTTVGQLARHAAEIGRLLLAAQIKVKVEEGGWIEWVESNCPFGRRQASKYLMIAKADGNHDSHLNNGSRSLRASLRSLIAPADEANGEAKPRARRQEPAAPDEFNAQRAITRIIAQLTNSITGWNQEDLDELALNLVHFAKQIQSKDTRI